MDQRLDKITRAEPLHGKFSAQAEVVEMLFARVQKRGRTDPKGFPASPCPIWPSNSVCVPKRLIPTT
jgi:hypothetical protein